MPVIRAVLFDLDDTLFDYSKTMEQAQIAWLDKVRSSCDVNSLELAKYGDWKTMEKVVKQVVEEHPDLKDDKCAIWRRALAQVLEGVGVEAPLIDSAFEAWYTKRVKQPVFLKDALGTVRHLKAAGFVLGSVSDDIADPLQIKSLAPLFDFAVTSREASAEKPSPLIFNLGLSRAGCNASEAVFVGDNYNKDVEGAKAVGIKVIWVDSPGTYEKIAKRYQRPKEPLQCNAEVKSVAEVAKVVLTWSSEAADDEALSTCKKRPRLDSSGSAQIDSILQKACNSGVIAWEQIGPERSMDLSGSSVRELRCLYKDVLSAPPLLILKQTSKKYPTLPSNASASERMKAERNDFSYSSECAFLHAHAELLLSYGCCVPKVVHVDVGDAHFVVLVESLSASLGWEQPSTIPAGASVHAILRWLAKFHAAYLPKSLGGGGLPLQTSGAWECGLQNMALERRPASELEQLGKTLTDFAEAFSGADPYFGTEGARRLGPRLQAVAKDVAWHLRPRLSKDHGGGACNVTMTHGDFMHSNFFLRATEGEDLEAAVIDWQWAGPGVGGVDLFFVCAQSLSDELVDNYEKAVIRPYYDELIAALGGRQESYAYEEVLREFQLAGLNFMRWLTCARLVGFTPAKMQEAAKKADPNRGMVRKSMARMVWLWQRTEEFLENAEKGKLYPNNPEV